MATLDPIVEANREAIGDLCRRHRVARLALFGSRASGRFDPAKSDFDFLVCFSDTTPGTYALRYLALAEDLERLLGRSVDLITERSLRNPHFREVVEEALVEVF
jgi:uncharacterized protein